MNQELPLQDIVEFLLDVHLFHMLNEGELADFISIAKLQHYQSGTTLFSEGDLGDAFYVIYKGSIQVKRRNPFHEQSQIANLIAGTCFGEMAILDDSPRSATIIITEESILLRFSKREFLGLIKSQSVAAYKVIHSMAQQLAQRQRSLNQRIENMDRDMNDLEELWLELTLEADEQEENTSNKNNETESKERINL